MADRDARAAAGLRWALARPSTRMEAVMYDRTDRPVRSFLPAEAVEVVRVLGPEVKAAVLEAAGRGAFRLAEGALLASTWCQVQGMHLLGRADRTAPPSGPRRASRNEVVHLPTAEELARARSKAAHPSSQPPREVL